MVRRFWFLTCVLLLPSLIQAQDLPTLDPAAFFWETWDFQEPPGAAVFVLDGNRQGDLLAESGRPFLFQQSTQAFPLACADGGWFTGGSVNTQGWVLGSCREQGRDVAVILTAQGAGYAPAVTMTLPGASLQGFGLNDWGNAVGSYMSESEGGPHPVFMVGLWGGGGAVVPLRAVIPGSDIQSTVLTGLSNTWVASGYYTSLDPTPDGPRVRTHGVVFVMWDQWIQWDAPGATRTLLFDINEQLRAVGIITDANFEGHSVLADPGTAQWYHIEHPDPNVLFTDVSGILPGEPLTFVGRLILPHPTDPNTNKVLGFRAVLKPSGFDPPPVSQPGVAAIAQSQRGVALTSLPTVARLPRPAMVLNLESCDEGPGMVVPMRMRQVLGCP